MKLVESPLTSNLDLRQAFPNVVNFINRKMTVKFFKRYTLNYNQVLLADTYEEVVVFMVNHKKKVGEDEIQYLISNLLAVAATEVEVIRDEKARLIGEGYPIPQDVKDIVLIRKK